MSEKDYYKLLGVERNATADEIKQAYRKMAKKYHPDLYTTASDEEKKKAEAQFKEINHAYDVLSEDSCPMQKSIKRKRKKSMTVTATKTLRDLAVSAVADKVLADLAQAVSTISFQAYFRDSVWAARRERETQIHRVVDKIF